MHNFSISEAVRKTWLATPWTQSSVQMDVFYGMEKDGSSLPRGQFRNSCGMAINGEVYLLKMGVQFSVLMAIRCGQEKYGSQLLQMKIKNLKAKLLKIRASLLIL